MQMEVTFDRDRLRHEIQALLKSGAAKNVKDVTLPSELQPFEMYLARMVRQEIARHDLTRDVKIVDGCDDCFGGARLKKAKILGSGGFGTVFDMGKGRCVKIETVTNASVRKGVEIAIQMGRLGVGPKVHGWRVCSCDGSLYAVTEMDRIAGSTLDEWLTKKHTTQVTASVRAKLKAKIAKMNKVGVTHGDLHEGNVMVDAKNLPWIIDFTYEPVTVKPSQGNMRILDRFDGTGMFGANERAVLSALVAKGVITLRGIQDPSTSVVAKRLKHWVQ